MKIIIGNDHRGLKLKEQILKYLLSKNYDVENIYIDGLLGIVSCDLEETSYLFNKLRSLSTKFGVNIFININYEYEDDIPEFVKEHVA